MERKKILRHTWTELVAHRLGTTALLTARGGALALDDLYQQCDEESKPLLTAGSSGARQKDHAQRMGSGDFDPIEPGERARRRP